MLTRIKNWIGNLVSAEALQERCVPEIETEDLFLVSYPKSGNTWMRFILANLIRTEDQPTVNFLSVWDYVSEYEIKPEFMEKAPRPRAIKSHSLYNSDFPYVIYIIRDPRDVAISYYHYLAKVLPDEMTLSKFIRSDKYGVHKWSEHVESWTGKENVLVFKYENLIDDAVKEVSKINAFWPHRSFSDSLIEQAVAASQLDKMRKAETEFGHPDRPSGKVTWEKTFLRKGTSKNWEKEMSAEDADYISSTYQSTMKKYGYE